MTTPAAVAVGRARRGVVVGMIGFAAAAWLYIALVASQMGNMTSMLAMPMTAAWTPTQSALMVLMWAVMMAAMMLPSAIPMVVAYDRFDGAAGVVRSGSTSLFVSGYLVVWSVFAIAATSLQWTLHNAVLVNGMGESTQASVAGVLLVGAGLFQFTPLKQKSLRACRTPMGFLMTSWREGRLGALRMGVHHGMSCLGCCWAVMMLLFVLGVMNLVWVVVIALFVLAEKVFKRGETIAKVGGVVMIAWGVVAFIAG